MLTYNLCNSQPTMFFLQWEQSDNEIQIQRTRKPGNKNNNKNKNKQQLQKCSPVSNVSAPSSPQRHQSGVYDTNRFFCNLFFIWCVRLTCTDQLGVGEPHPCPCPPPDFSLLDHRSDVVQRDDRYYQIWEKWQGWPTWPPDLPMLSKSLQSSGIWKMCV